MLFQAMIFIARIETQTAVNTGFDSGDEDRRPRVIGRSMTAFTRLDQHFGGTLNQSVR